MLILQMLCTDMLDLPLSYTMTNMSLSIITSIIKTITFIYFVYLLKTLYNYEYKECVKPLTLYFILDFFSYFI